MVQRCSFSIKSILFFSSFKYFKCSNSLRKESKCFFIPKRFLDRSTQLLQEASRFLGLPEHSPSTSENLYKTPREDATTSSPR